jgi:hypothetical protein
VATEPAFGSITVVTVDQGGSAPAGACYTLGAAPGFFAANGTCGGADGTVVFSGFWARDGNVQPTQPAIGLGCQVNGAIPPLTFSKAKPTQELTVADTFQPAANARNGQPAVTTAQGTRDAATRLGTDLPLVATNALSASVRGNAERG